MRAAGLKVLTVRDILSFGVDDHMGARVELEELATKALQYEMAEGFKVEDLAEKVCWRRRQDTATAPCRDDEHLALLLCHIDFLSHNLSSMEGP